MADLDPALRFRPAAYDTDFIEWTVKQAALLRDGMLHAIDIENIAEEIESLGKSDRRSVVSQMTRLIEHLVKLQISQDIDPRVGWCDSIRNARSEIELVFEDSPSLNAQRTELFARAYGRGVDAAIAGLRRDDEIAQAARFRTTKPSFDVDLALDKDYFPAP